MKVFTSYFANIANLPKDFSLFSIAGKTPEGFNGKILPMFAPQYAWWREWHDRFRDNLESDEAKSFYTRKYQETVLSKVDVSQVERCFALAGGTPCLLCYEKPEKFCHRHIVARFLEKIGFETEEYR